MVSQKLIKSRDLICDLMDTLKVKEPAGPLDNASYGFFSSRAATGQLVRRQFTLLSSDDPLSALANVVSNMVLFERPAAFLCLETTPSAIATKVLSIISGVDVSDLRVAPHAFPAVNDAAGDIWSAPLVFCSLKGFVWKSLDKFAATMANQGIGTIFIDAPRAVRATQKTASMEEDFPLICQGLCTLARRHGLCIVGGHRSKDLVEMAALVDQVVRFEDLGDTMRIGVLRRGEVRPEFTLARREVCGRINDVTRYPWDSSAGKRFAKARKS